MHSVRFFIDLFLISEMKVISRSVSFVTKQTHKKAQKNTNLAIFTVGMSEMQDL